MMNNMANHSEEWLVDNVDSYLDIAPVCGKTQLRGGARHLWNPTLSKGLLSCLLTNSHWGECSKNALALRVSKDKAAYYLVSRPRLQRQLRLS